MMRSEEHVAPKGGGDAYKILFGKPARQRSLVRTRRRWDNYIKMGFEERVCRRHGLDFGEEL
jgi:hypothetical protein